MSVTSLLLLLAPSVGFAQDSSSGPGAGQAFLARFVGDWDVRKTFHPRQGAPVRVEGSCRQELIHDGRFLRSSFVFRTPEGDLDGTGLIGFDPETGLFTSVWIDARSARVSIRRSERPFDGERIELASQPLGGAEGDVRRSRTVTTLEDGGRRILHQQFALADGAEDRLVMELVLTRRSSSGSDPRDSGSK
jgi:hypothetical protein